jgi:hydrocephalus-inducing protein
MENFNAAPSHPRSVTFAQNDARPMTAASLVARGEDGRPLSAASTVLSDVAYTPFSIEPENGRIAPGKKGNFVVKFSPLDVSDYDARLICRFVECFVLYFFFIAVLFSVPNMESGKQGPVIALKAKSLMPYCHFELEDSDYIRSARRNPELRGPGGAPPGTTLDPNTRVIEMTNIGVGVRNCKKFDIYNPTNQDYTYQWINEDEVNPKKESDFRCIIMGGTIRTGKKVEVIS